VQSCGKCWRFELYHSWDIVDQFKWERDFQYNIQWTSTDSILTSWKSRRDSNVDSIKVPKKQITIALESIAHNIVAFPNASVEVSDSESDCEND
jgi:hypothetical protein